MAVLSPVIHYVYFPYGDCIAVIRIHKIVSMVYCKQKQESKRKNDFESHAPKKLIHKVTDFQFTLLNLSFKAPVKMRQATAYRPHHVYPFERFVSKIIVITSW